MGGVGGWVGEWSELYHKVLVGRSCAHAAAIVVAAHDDVLDLEVVDGCIGHVTAAHGGTDRRRHNHSLDTTEPNSVTAATPTPKKCANESKVLANQGAPSVVRAARPWADHGTVQPPRRAPRVTGV